MTQLFALGIPLAIAMTTRARRGPRTPMTGPIIKSFPEEDWLARDEMIVAAVQAGKHDPILWRFVTSSGDGALAGYELDTPVMADALKIEGVRVTPSYNAAQRIADALTAEAPAAGPVVMMTPWLDALTFEQADAQLPMTTSGQLSNKGVTKKTSQMIEASAMVDHKLSQQSGLPDVPIVGNPGKNWVLTEKFLWPGRHHETNVLHSEAAANQGFYPVGRAWDPIQYRGVAHDRSHTDYSQVLRLMGPTSYLREPGFQATSELPLGIPVATADILKDPNLGPLLSGTKGQPRGKMLGEGYLPFDRHPKLGAAA